MLLLVLTFSEYGYRDEFLYIESSLPRNKGDKAFFETQIVPSFYNCLTFDYHMYGKNMGRLNIYSQLENDREILKWRLGGDHGNQWHQARVPVEEDYPYKVG